MLIVIASVTAIALVLDAWASVSILRSDVIGRPQKTAQLIVVWALPVLGAVLALIITRESEVVSPRKGSMDSGPEVGIALGGGDLRNHNHDHSSGV
ncbi:MAG TPA: hypothetical protein VHZ99_11490 [Steroidobacteraceae bacterium]|nr:hypothetical protein [Steroidobacteraceae bacterium]